MRNPLRSEGEAFQFLLVVIAAAIVIAAAEALNMWLGVAAAVIVVAAVVVWLRRPRVEPVQQPEPVTSAPTNGRRRVLLLAPADAAVGDLRERMRSHLEQQERDAEVLVVVPALATPVEATTGAVDDRREDAQREADALAAQLAAAGVHSRGAVGADDPLLALEDALREFGADEVLLAGDASLLSVAQARLAVPVSLLS